jgi:hypothetical protein
MSYRVDLAQVHRRSAVFIDKILKGAKPGDLPVEQPTKFELVVDLKTAKAWASPSRSRCCCAPMRSFSNARRSVWFVEIEEYRRAKPVRSRRPTPQ